MISKDDIEHLKELARVEFNEKETAKLAKDLGEVLDYVGKLKEADISGAPEMTHSVDLKNVFRADASAESPQSGAAKSNQQGEIVRSVIDAFPEKTDFGHGTYLKVKPIL